jgi:Zn-dependent protease with chaperone function
MTQTLPHQYDAHEPEPDGPIRLPDVELPPAPSRLRRAHFLGLVLAGYAYVLGMLALFALVLVAVAAAGAIWAVFAVGAVFVVVLPALRLRIPPPEGERLTRDNAPRLLEMVERRRRELRAPRLSGVLVVADPNAFVREVPRLGVLGWNRIYLGLGLPYLLALTPEELEAVVAHELAHVARRHGAGAAGLRGSLARWEQLDERLDERQHWSGRFFRPFLSRYLPRLERATLAFKRWHEYEADRAAAAAAGADAAATGLLRVALLDRHLDETVWDETMRRADVQPRPAAPYSLMRRAARQDFRHKRARLAELLRHVDSDWTHPTYAQRLRAIGLAAAEPSRLKPPTATAAEVYLEPGLQELIAAFDESWQTWIDELWRERYDEAQALQEELAALEASGDGSPDGRRRRALLTARFGGAAAAQREFELVLRDDPESSIAHYWVGRSLLGAGDERGLDSLARAVELDVHATPDAGETAIAFLVDRGRRDEIDAWRARLDEYGRRVARAGAERSRLRPDDEVEPHGLADDVVELIRSDLADLREVRRAYLVRKRCLEFDDDSLWVIGLQLRSRPFRLRRQRGVDDVLQTALQRLEPILGDSVWVVILEGAYAPLEPAMDAVPDSRLVGRRRRAARLHRRAGIRSYGFAGIVVLAALVGLIRLLDGDSGAAIATESQRQSAGAPAGVTAWAASANATCASIRANFGDPAGRATQVTLERALIEALAADATTSVSAVAIGLAQRRLVTLEHALALEQEGRRDRMSVELRRHDGDVTVRRALTALGAPDCAAP